MTDPVFHIDDPKTDVYVGDCRKILPQFPAELAELIVSDPPFNWGVEYGSWDDRLKREDYLKFTYRWLAECVRILKPNGSLWVNIPDDTQAEVVVFLKECGLQMVNHCIWHFRFGQCRSSNFIVSKTHALYFAKDRNNRVWNPQDILEPSDRASIYDDPRTRTSKTPGMRVPLDVWYGKHWGRIQGNNKERMSEHQNQLPEVYLERIIRACSRPEGLVIDPFLGSGTSSVVAHALRRRSIGIEIDARLASLAFDRIQRGSVRVQ